MIASVCRFFFRDLRILSEHVVFSNPQNSHGHVEGSFDTLADNFSLNVQKLKSFSGKKSKMFLRTRRMEFWQFFRQFSAQSPKTFAQSPKKFIILFLPQIIPLDK